jgi:hypothetical protein
VHYHLHLMDHNWSLHLPPVIVAATTRPRVLHYPNSHPGGFLPLHTTTIPRPRSFLSFTIPARKTANSRMRLIFCTIHIHNPLHRPHPRVQSTTAPGGEDTSGVRHGVHTSKYNISVSVRARVYHGKYLSLQGCIYK